MFNYYNPEKYINLAIDVIYVGGGNTFSLLDRLRKCGFDKEIVRYVKNGVVYIGGSAGTHIVTKNVEHVLRFDENEVNMTDFDALSLFDGIIFCHYSDDREDAYRKALKENKYHVYKLTNDESIVIEN